MRQTPEGLEEELYTQIATAVRNEMSYLPPTAYIPAILTTDGLRTIVRATLAQEFPRITVVSYSDLPPHYNIQPVARISWR